MDVTYVFLYDSNISMLYFSDTLSCRSRPVSAMWSLMIQQVSALPYISPTQSSLTELLLLSQCWMVFSTIFFCFRPGMQKWRIFH